MSRGNGTAVSPTVLRLDEDVVALGRVPVRFGEGGCLRLGGVELAMVGVDPLCGPTGGVVLTAYDDDRAEVRMIVGEFAIAPGDAAEVAQRAVLKHGRLH